MGVLVRGLIIAGIVWMVFRWLSRLLQPAMTNTDSQASGATQKSATRKTSPYEVLQVPQGASAQEIRKAYHRQLAQYHPDKVAEMGPEIQKVAEEKTAEIIDSYKELVD